MNKVGSTVCGILAVVVWIPEASGWQTNGGDANAPQEFIESSSPLESGGIVTSLRRLDGSAIPVGGAQSANGEKSVLSGNSLGVTAPVGAGQTGPAPAATIPRVAASPNFAGAPQAVVPQSPGVPQPGQQVYAPQGYVAAPPANTGQPMTAPSLGYPVPWTHAMSPRGLCGWRSNFTQPVYAPASSVGVQPPPASLPPTLGTGAATMTPSYPAPFNPLAPQRPVYTPLVKLVNMPPSTWPGQGIIGSPKLYVDGQPVRNLMRYLIIP